MGCLKPQGSAKKESYLVSALSLFSFLYGVPTFRETLSYNSVERAPGGDLQQFGCGPPAVVKRFVRGSRCVWLTRIPDQRPLAGSAGVYIVYSCTYIHLSYVHIYLLMCRCICVYVYVYMYVCKCVYIYTHIHTALCMHA